MNYQRTTTFSLRRRKNKLKWIRFGFDENFVELGIEIVELKINKTSGCYKTVATILISSRAQIQKKRKKSQTPHHVSYHTEMGIPNDGSHFFAASFFNVQKSNAVECRDSSLLF